MKDSKIMFDKEYWTFVYLVITDESYLNDEGKLLASIVNKKGYCDSISQAARKMRQRVSKIWKVCHDIEKKGHINLIKVGHSQRIFFSKQVQEEAVQLLKTILQDEI